MTRWTIMLAIVLACAVPRAVLAQTPSLADVRKLYDAGQYQQAAAAAARAGDDPRITYLLAQSHQKLSHNDEARAAYEKLAARGDDDPWHHVGRSGIALLSSNTAEGVAAGAKAVGHDGAPAEAYYQHGVALSLNNDMNGASAAFQKATELDPNWAYAHYFAGLAYSKINRKDLTASHFKTFLDLAPKAPERPQVQSLLRTIGGGL
jgi:tetratricopeptide (TPR) repeat protein